ncbi:MAG: hypothetical protein K1X92_07075 [Bacteroidia bacterium]|nr:hypothetical protein [Bacteroidia bacterium]
MFIQKKGVISGVCLVLFFTVFLNGFTQSVLPEGYPKLMDTGNPVEDHKKYDAAKQAWIAANPAAYAKIIADGQNSSTSSLVEVVPTTDQKPLQIPSNMPSNNPIVEQKAVMIPPYNPGQNTEQQVTTVMTINKHMLAPSKEIVLPNDYPKYVDTGNTQQDLQKYDIAKQAWIAANPSEYAKLNVRNRQLIDKQEFEKMPSEKRQHILQNPDLYFIGEGQK